MLNEKERINKLNEIQDEIVGKVWQNHSQTLNLATRSGKNYTALKVIKRKLEEGQLSKGDKLIFLAEVTIRPEASFIPDFKKFAKTHKWDINKYFDVEFFTYQSKPDLSDYALAVLDESHDACTDSRIYLFSDFPNVQKICLTATPKRDSNVFKLGEDDPLYDELNIYQSQEDTDNKKITQYVTKGQIYEMFTPITVELPLYKLIEQGVLPSFETTVITHELAKSGKKHLIWKGAGVKGYEYDFYHKKYDWAKQMWKEPKQFRKVTLMSVLPRFLYNLDSKVEVCKALHWVLSQDKENKVLWFAKSGEFLRQFLPEDQLCLRQYPDKKTKSNKEIFRILEDFKQDRYQHIGSSQMLQQGLTIPAINTIVIPSYDSKAEKAIQIIARSLTPKQGKVSKIIIFRTNGTMEEKWFDKLSVIKTSKGKHKETFNLNVTKITDSRQILLANKKLKNEPKTK